MTHHHKHDIKQDIKTKEPDHQNQTGRSMVEMLGVLAVAGVLSVGGIMAYQSAMNKHRANNIMDGVSKRATILTAQALEGTGYNLGEFDDTIDGTYGVELVPQTGYENEFGLKVTGISEKVCSKIMDMDWSQPREITGDTGCDADENVLTFAFAANGDNTTTRTAMPKECSGTRPSCQKCDTGTGSYVTDTSKNDTQDTCGSGQVCADGLCQSPVYECTGERPACQVCDTSTGNWVADIARDNTQDKCESTQLCNTGTCRTVVFECSGVQPSCQKCDTATGNYVTDTDKNDTQDTCADGYECNNGVCTQEVVTELPVTTIPAAVSCTSNSECSSGEYCKFSPSSFSDPGTGTCTTLDSGTTKGEYLVSSSRMDWWSAKNWCAAHNNMSLIDATSSPLNCSTSSHSCPDWSAFTNLGLNSYYWTNKDYGNSCDAWFVGVGNKAFYYSSRDDGTLYALCE